MAMVLSGEGGGQYGYGVVRGGRGQCGYGVVRGEGVDMDMLL